MRFFVLILIFNYFQIFTKSFISFDKMESQQINTDWYEYQCKSGQPVFYYNKTTGEHRWLVDYSGADCDVQVSLF